MKNLLFSEVVSCLGVKNINVTNDFIVKGVSTDTRTLNKGDLYIALSGDNYDGHSFVSVAAQKEACAVICSKDVTTNIPVIQVENTLSALKDLATYYRNKFDIPIIAVTGSNGKTTTKNMIATILASKYKVYFTDKNYNNEIGLPRSILEMDDSYDVAVLELGMNHLGEIETLSKIAKPDIAVITNIGKAHIGNLGSQENILKAKLEILAGLKPNGLLVLNGDDKYLGKLKINTHKTAFIGTDDTRNFSLFASDINANSNPSYFTVVYDDESIPCVLPTFGKHNVTNALLALYCGLQLGISLSDAIAELKRYTVSPMRTEIALVKGITIIKDYYNSSPDSARVAIEGLATYNVKGKKIAILGEMLELGDYSNDEHFKLAEVCVDNGIDYVFFIGTDADSFKNGLVTGKGEFYQIDERTLLAKSLLNYVNSGLLNSGDVILIKGSRGMKMEEVYELLKSYINAIKSDFTALPPSPTKLYVDINSVKFNYSQIKNAVGTKVEIMPMVKANAYGCGTDIIANVFRNSKYLAVADVKEAALIRRILPDANFVIIYQPFSGDIQEIVSQGYIASVSDLNFAKKMNTEAIKQSKKCKIHIEVDTGSGRLGINVNDCVDFAREVACLENLTVEGIFMHYICADSFDESDLAFTERQTKLFTKAVADIENVLGEVKFKHACAGAAIFNQKAAHFNMVRPGYMLYGYYPSEILKEKVILKPALKYVSVIIQISEHEEGTPISYNRKFVTSRKSKIATVSVGYSDGVCRHLYNLKNEHNGCFVVNGQRAPIVGTICMDLTMIDITDIEGTIAVGDEVAIFDNVNVTIEEIAQICDTIGYEIISQIEDKADRVESF
ncbi:MAG: alanine racemase [Clostridiales bacterium]|jgi:alanine racemase|nr:alanine racemase [Clostridiales bacterium]